MDAKVTWHKGMAFTGTADSGFQVNLDAWKQDGGDETGFRPLELMLVSLGGCTAMDVISILKKKQQDVTGFEVRAHADRATEHPKVFTHVVLEYVITGHNVQRAAAERAVELSVTKYCPAQHMLRQAVAIETKITLVQAA